MGKAARWALTVLVLTGTFMACNPQQSDERAGEIKERTAAYVTAYNNQDAEALASFWADDASYVSPREGVELQGSNAIVEQFIGLFNEEGKSQLAIKIGSIEFPDANTAIERGRATVTKEGEEAMELAYKVKYTLHDGTWLISRVSEMEVYPPGSNHEELKALDWLVGSWINKGEDAEVRSAFVWDKTKNFLTHSFELKILGEDELHGREIIAWDPAQGIIRSWLFDSEGGFGEGVWRNEGERLIVETAHTLPDGRKASAINTYTKVDSNSFSWESTGREVDGELMPDIDPVTVRRGEG